ncbi:hypothetical protein MMC12_002631 [Toensbergia leucococca]|nr:hypothetical protein [Toensbergia leucococca]
MAQLQAQPNYVDIIGQLCDEIGQLRDEMRQSATRMTERFDSLQTEMITMRAAVTTVQADITIIQADISAIHTQLDASEGNAIARLFNSTINNPQTPFQPLQNRHNMPVQSFPENATELTTILREYNLSNDGSVIDKRKRLAQYIGVVVQVF